MRKYYENSVQVQMVKISTRAEYDRLCETVAKNISKKEVERWVTVNNLKNICLTAKMLENIKRYIDVKMEKRPALAAFQVFNEHVVMKTMCFITFSMPFLCHSLENNDPSQASKVPCVPNAKKKCNSGDI